MRRAQRGLTVYVVVLVIAMLAAVGVFAAKSASLALAQGGYVRQATQTHYVTEYAIDATLAAVASDVPGHIQQIETYNAEAIAASPVVGWQDCKNAGLANARCYKFARAGLQARLTGHNELFEASAATTGTLGAPGSLGRSNLAPNFIVEATDLAQVPAPPAGERAGGAPVLYYSVTFTAIADVGAPVDTVTPGSAADKLHRVTMNLESARVQTTLGPVPAR